ncbi:YdcF family protein [Alicyclobacillus dauci]|uniref:YdcF family protein n=1 Tax=Alicyclobacillus dauci TaxID=1475485 RepID=A0ABY6Z1H1_9BACL|nr:YdcF family protein [Alicyclobacillus dauci]WAH36743.1 YdcF family protein [Alicyclobacillus dauci]
MFYILKVIQHLILPPGLFVVLAIIVAARIYKTARKAAFALFGIAAFIYVCSAPMVADALLHPLEQRYTQPKNPSGDVIVVLGASFSVGTPSFEGTGNLTGDSAARVLAAARLQKQLHIPIIVSGGPLEHVGGESVSFASIARHDLNGIGVASNQIYLDQESRNTQENAVNTKVILDNHKFKHPILITSAYHMERSVLDFQRIGIAVTPFPTDYEVSSQGQPYDVAWLPSADGLSLAEIALKEYLGILATNMGIRG